MRTPLVSALALALTFGGAAYAADSNVPSGDEVTDGKITMPGESYDAMDTDRDGAISDKEWTAGAKRDRLYEAYDVDGDGVIDRQEFYSGEWKRHDKNRDNEMSMEEYGRFHTEQEFMMPGNSGRLGK